MSKETEKLMLKLVAEKIQRGLIFATLLATLAWVDRTMGTQTPGGASPRWREATSRAIGRVVGKCFKPVIWAEGTVHYAKIGIEIATVGEDFWFRSRSVR